MARPLRPEFEGAVYHVMARGHEKRELFLDDRDRRRFLEILGESCTRQGWVVHAYCLMGNHYHLLLETPRGVLSSGMHDLNGHYAQWFNHRYGRTGHLFEGRFRAIVVEKHAHLLELTRYIVLNPVRSGLVSTPGDWVWSNYLSTAGFREGPSWLETDWTLTQFARSRRAARECYWRFVQEGLDRPLSEPPVRSGIYLGSDEFIAVLRLTRQEYANDIEIPVPQRRPDAIPIRDIRRAVALRYAIPDEQLSTRNCREAKYAAIWLARRLTGQNCRDVGIEFRVTGARVSQVVRQVDGGTLVHLRPMLEELARRMSAFDGRGKDY
ncbi:MAG TPA: transposase [Thermoanaerobaculia bacterium]